MKKTIIALVALAGVASAGSVLTADFTTGSQPDGWDTTNLKNNHTPHFTWNGNGAINNGNWTVVSLSTAVNLTSDKTYTIKFDTYSNGNENQNVFYLSSDTYSLAIGNSYNSNNYVSIGQMDTAAQGVRISFQKADGATQITDLLDTSTANDVSVHTNLSYTLTLSAGTLAVSVVDGANPSKTWATSVDIADSFNFTSLGWAVDGSSGATGIQNISITTPDIPSGEGTIPEPTTATLSLLALAGLAARRRRK